MFALLTEIRLIYDIIYNTLCFLIMMKKIIDIKMSIRFSIICCNLFKLN